MVIQERHRNSKVCYLCGEAGHFCKDCPKNIHQNLLKFKHKGKSACLISKGESCSDSESDEKVFGVSSQSHNPNVWIVDLAQLKQTYAFHTKRV